MPDVAPDTRLFQRLARREPAFGTYTYTAAPEIVEVLGAVGFDYVIVDMMVQATNWETSARLAAAAYQFGVTPWIRLQAFPWSEGGVVDGRLPADVLRALSIGFQVVQVAVDGVAAVELAMLARDNNHRRPYLPGYDHVAHSPADASEAQAQISARTLIIPSIESARGIAAFDRILEVEGMRAVKFGMGDLLQTLGHKGDQGHPEVREFITDATRRAAERGVHVVVNMVGPDTPEAIFETATWLHAAGVAVIEVPHFIRHMTRFYERSLALGRTLGPRQ